MNTTAQKTRSEIPAEYKWDLESMYQSDDQVLQDLDTALSKSDELSEMEGRIMGSAETLLRTLTLYSDTSQLIEKAFAYSHMRHDEDNSNSVYTELYGKCASAYTSFSAKASFIEPEILSSDPSLIDSYIGQLDGLGTYSFMLHELMKSREHTLSAEQEHVIASYGEILGASNDIFASLNYADLKFGEITLSDGTAQPLTLSSYIKYMESDDRDVRKQAYEKLYEQYRAHVNVLTSIYSSNVRKDTVTAGLRNYASSIEASLDPHSIPVSVYDNLIAAVRAHLPSMHKYVGIRKRALGLEDIRMYDVYAPLTGSQDKHYTFEQAVDLACEALSPMGPEYVEAFRKGVTEDRWVDIYENPGKTSGAYSFGSYDSKPFILMNFGGKLRDVFTLIHEGGHSMHSYYTRSTQPYIYGGHSIFTAEVASTVNETLLMNHLIDNADSDEMLAYLVNFYIDEFKGTVFRQTMFAEFEKNAHDYVEAGGSLTSEWLNAEYSMLNAEYFGPEMVQDDLIGYEWSRIPHFYRSFYVYQYATGFSAANAIAHKLLTEGEPARDGYIRFLRSGASDTPIELLKIAGVDMSTDGPVNMALDTFDKLVTRLDDLL